MGNDLNKMGRFRTDKPWRDHRATVFDAQGKGSNDRRWIDRSSGGTLRIPYQQDLGNERTDNRRNGRGRQVHALLVDILNDC